MKQTSKAYKKQQAKHGAKGGKAKVPKGFALMDKDRLKEVASRGGQADRKNMQKMPQTPEDNKD
jgi:general stress protein YciG